MLRIMCEETERHHIDHAHDELAQVSLVTFGFQYTTDYMYPYCTYNLLYTCWLYLIINRQSEQGDLPSSVLGAPQESSDVGVCV